jgi:hypothetical protein
MPDHTIPMRRSGLCASGLAPCVGHDREGSGTTTSTRSFAIIEKLVELMIPKGF